MDKKVSVVVPIYKVEKYLDRCVGSIINQTYKNLEIVLVDDGSPDNCPAMCEAWAEKDSRIKVVHKKNGGLPDARNAGIDVVTGEYLLFVDSDDWIEPQTVAELVEVIEEKNVDFVTFGAVWDGRAGIPDGTPCTYEKSRQVGKGYYDKARIQKEIYPRVLVTPDLYFGPILSACFSIYRKEFLDKNGIRFDAEIKYCEDHVYNCRVAVFAESFYVTDKHYYHYCFNGASISQSFHADAWDIAKKRCTYFEKYFTGCTKFDSELQLKRIAIFCVLNGLSERRYIKNPDEKVAYIRKIFNDPMTKKAMKHIGVAKVPRKKRFLLILVKLRMVKLYNRIYCH
ncbi:MAG: glycosyltransferase family 2 protein [Clostridia bacterium]|nr:glycosyltransferase family 2 protein [Clostridia bacterium]